MKKLMISMDSQHYDLIKSAAAYDGMASVNMWIVMQAVRAARSLMGKNSPNNHKDAPKEDTPEIKALRLLIAAAQKKRPDEEVYVDDYDTSKGVTTAREYIEVQQARLATLLEG